MATKELKVLIQLRRDTAANYEKIKDSYVPRKGEVVLVDTASDGLRAKVGDGEKTYAQLGFADDVLRDLVSNIIVRGYYIDGEFYSDEQKSSKYVKYSYKLYVDIPTSYVYTCDGTQYILIKTYVNAASAVTPGIMKLYSTPGQNIDGTMSQQVITNGVNSIQLTMDDESPECLVLDLPWD